MSDEKYRRLAGDILPPDTRDVLQWQNGIHFRCPCGQRRVYVTEPPHEIKFDSDECLTLDESVGSHEKTRLSNEDPAGDEWCQRPAKWCHFWIKAGVPEMCADAKCPGGVV